MTTTKKISAGYYAIMPIIDQGVKCSPEGFSIERECEGWILKNAEGEQCGVFNNKKQALIAYCKWYSC